jgi:hypothetical protein
VVDSKSQSVGYNYLDACQAMDGVWVVGQVPSWPFYGLATHPLFNTIFREKLVLAGMDLCG